MNFLFAIKNESETAADPGDLGSVLISLQKLFGEGVKMIKGSGWATQRFLVKRWVLDKGHAIACRAPAHLPST